MSPALIPVAEKGRQGCASNILYLSPMGYTALNLSQAPRFNFVQ